MTPRRMTRRARCASTHTKRPRVAPPRPNFPHRYPLRPGHPRNMVWPAIQASQPTVQGITMADLPRLNQVIKAFESGQPAFTTFSPAEIEPAVALAQSKFDGVVYEMEHNFWDARMLRDALQYMLNRRQLVTGGSLAPAVHADGAHPAERRRAQPVARQAGARPRRLRRAVAAHLDRRPGLQRGRGLPLSAAEDRAALRAGRHPRRRPDHRGALLGPHPAGVLQEGRRLAARSGRRGAGDADDRGHAGDREPRRHPRQGARHRPDPDRRRATSARSSASRASTSTRRCSTR